MYNLSTKAHKGPQQPTKADAGPQRWKTAQTMERYVFFLLYNLFISYITSRLHHPPHPSLAWTTATKAHKGPSSQQRPTQAHEEEKGPKQCQTHRLGHRLIPKYN